MKATAVAKVVVSALLICIGLNSLCLGAWQATTYSDWLTDTPPENVFRVEGDNREFILLDVTDNPDSKFFILAKEYYSDREFDLSDKSLFDPTNGRNIAGWLNGSFLKYGNTVASGETMKFPTGIIDHINRNHIWITDGEPADSEALGTYAVSLLSQEEILKYKDKFGVDDGLSTSLLFTNAYGWWVRSQDDPNSRGKIAFRFDRANDTNLHAWRASSNGDIVTRPCFYLKEDFFKNVRINTVDMGSAIKNAIKQNYFKEELTGIYTVEELQDVFGYKADVNISVTNMTNAKGEKIEKLLSADYVNTSVKAKSLLPGDNAFILAQVLYGEDNCPITFAIKTINLKFGEERDFQIGIKLISSQKEGGAYLKTYMLKAGAGLNTASNAVRINLN